LSDPSSVLKPIQRPSRREERRQRTFGPSQRRGHASVPELCASAADARPSSRCTRCSIRRGRWSPGSPPVRHRGRASPPTGNCHSTTRCRLVSGAAGNAASRTGRARGARAPPAPPRRPPGTGAATSPRRSNSRSPCVRASVRPRVRVPQGLREQRGTGERSAGSFCSAHSTAASTCGGMVLRCNLSERGSSVITRAMIACAVAPVNGGSAVSISYSTQPKRVDVPPSA